MMGAYNCEELVLEAIETGSFQKFRELIKSGLNLNTILYNCQRVRSTTILSTAAYEGQEKIVNYLIHECHAALNYKDPCWKRSALHWACVGGHLEIVNQLLHSGARVNSLDQDNVTPLVTVCMYHKWDIQLVEALIDKGADVQIQDRFNASPLHYATDRGSEKVIRTLIKAGCIFENSLVYGEGSPLCNLMDGHYSPELVFLLLEAGYDLNKHIHLMKMFQIFELCEDYKFVLYHYCNAPSLRHICRRVIRTQLGGQFLQHKIRRLPLPLEILSYVLLDNC